LESNRKDWLSQSKSLPARTLVPHWVLSSPDASFPRPYRLPDGGFARQTTPKPFLSRCEARQRQAGGSLRKLRELPNALLPRAAAFQIRPCNRLAAGYDLIRAARLIPENRTRTSGCRATFQVRAECAAMTTSENPTSSEPSAEFSSGSEQGSLTILDSGNAGSTTLSTRPPNEPSIIKAIARRPCASHGRGLPVVDGSSIFLKSSSRCVHFRVPLRMAGPIRHFSTDIAPIRLAEPAIQTIGVKTRQREKSKAKAPWMEFVTVLHLREEVPLRRHESVGKERGDGGC
jgi:hypothetical protein